MVQEQNPAGQTDSPQPSASHAKKVSTRPGRPAVSKVDVTIGINLRRIRKQFNLSQIELGNLLGVSFQQIQKYEQGVNRLTISRALDMCRVLHLSIGEFVVQLLQPRPKD